MMLRMLSNWAKTHISDAKASLMLSLLVSVAVVTFVAGFTSVAQARGFFADDTKESVSLATVTLSELPKQGQQVYALISQGGPFAYDKDGVVFGNREQQLPKHKRGYYREYTVKTSGVRNRGAKRIVCGGLQVQSPDVCYCKKAIRSTFFDRQIHHHRHC
jgi:ribonuclease T1